MGLVNILDMTKTNNFETNYICLDCTRENKKNVFIDEPFQAHFEKVHGFIPFATEIWNHVEDITN